MERAIDEKPYRITKTRSKRYVGQCSICTYTTNAMQHRIDVAQRLRDHCRKVHHTDTEDIFRTVVNRSLTRNQKGAQPMKQPGTDLPPIDADRLSDYAGHLVVLAHGKPGTRDTVHGVRVTREVLAYVYLDADEEKGTEAGWKAMGETPIFFKTVIKQIDEDGEADTDGNQTEPIGGILTKGTSRNGNEWAIVPTKKKDQIKLLDDFDEANVEAF